MFNPPPNRLARTSIPNLGVTMSKAAITASGNQKAAVCAEARRLSCCDVLGDEPTPSSIHVIGSNVRAAQCNKFIARRRHDPMGNCRIMPDSRELLSFGRKRKYLGERSVPSQ